MWLIIIIFLGPILYPVISLIYDSVSDKVKEISHNRYYGLKELLYVTTYQNSNISEKDIMNLFTAQIKTYRQQYYCIKHEVYTNKDQQNYAWSVKTNKNVFGWGEIYNIQCHFSNGYVYLSFSDSQFSSDGKSSSQYYVYGRDLGTGAIEKTLEICRENAIIFWKMNGREMDDDLPFNYTPLSGKPRLSSRKTTGEQTKKQSSYQDNSARPDLLAFYRNLLGLKLRFTQAELKNAYLDAVKKYHPDKYGSSSKRDRDNAEMLMKQVNEAYEKLKQATG